MGTHLYPVSTTPQNTLHSYSLGKLHEGCVFVQPGKWTAAERPGAALLDHMHLSIFILSISEYKSCLLTQQSNAKSKFESLPISRSAVNIVSVAPAVQECIPALLFTFHTTSMCACSVSMLSISPLFENIRCSNIILRVWCQLCFFSPSSLFLSLSAFWTPKPCLSFSWNKF